MDVYSGVRELVVTDEKLQDFYEDGKEYNFYTNEYIKVKNTNDEVIYLAKWDGEKVVPLRYKKIETEYFGDIKALNDNQKFYISMLQDKSIVGKFCCGSYGTGKSYLALSWAFAELANKRSKYQCIHYIRNNIIAKDTVDIGALPNGANEKLKPWAMEMTDILGDEGQLDYYISQGKVRLENMGFARGRSWDNSIIFLEEAQNTTPYLMSLILSRTGKDSCFIAVGDMRQTDKQVFDKNSGFNKAVQKLKGHPLFGFVTLTENERSEFSSLADLLLEE